MNRAVRIIIVGIVTGFTGVFCGIDVVGQDDVSNRQKFEGKWVLNIERSSNIPRQMQDQVLQITISEPEFKVEKTQITNNETRSITMTLFTDKRGGEE